MGEIMKFSKKNKTVKRKIASIGKAPGELVDYDINDSIEAKIFYASFNQDVFERKTLNNIQNLKKLYNAGHVNWLEIGGYDIEVIKAVGQQFAVHSLILEDINERVERPKIHSTDNYCFMTLNVYVFDEERIKIKQERFSMILFENLLITFEENTNSYLRPIIDRLRQNLGKIRGAGADYLAYSLLDAIVDQMFVTLESVGEYIDGLEIEITEEESNSLLRHIHKIKHQLMLMRRGIWPLREIFGALARNDHKLFKSYCNPYLRDLHDHALQAAEINESLREETISLIDFYMSSMANNLNQIMKVLSLISTIFLPLTFITSLYGMNFKYMPELDYRDAYPTIIFIMVSIAAFMLYYFKKKKWL